MSRKTLSSDYNNLIKQATRSLRKNQTYYEELLWEVVRNRQILGKKFLRQFPIKYKWRDKRRFFIADFYCHEGRLIVELDGAVHDKRKNYDQERDFVVKSLGIKTLRFKNQEVEADLSLVIQKIKDVLVSTPPLLLREGAGG